MAKKVDLKAKAKRQKVIAASGAFLLVAILVIQGPKTLKMLNPPAPPPPSAAPVAGGGTTDPSAVGGAGGAVPVASATLVDSDEPPDALRSQLVAFGRFASKDPFVQQVDPKKSVAAATPAGEGQAATVAQPEVPTPGAGASPGVGAPPVVTTGPGVVAPTPSASSGRVSSVVIAVNGVEETVTVGGEFPKAEPIFRLASATATTARIGIAGGALASGEAAVTLRKGKTVTLVNTADGLRYELKLVGGA